MPKKRKIPERTRWSSRQKTLNFTELIEAPPRLSPIPRRKHHSNAPLPVLQIEGETSSSSKTSKDTDMVISVPTTSKDDNRFGLKLENDGIKCNLCSKTFKTRPSFNAHRINMHNIVVRAQIKCPEPYCNTNSTTISALCEHITQHGKPLKEFNATFPTEGDFKIWLEDLTKDGSTQFVKPTGGRLKADGTGTQILNCNRTGIPRSTSDPDRTKGSSKIGVTCPAHIRVFYNRDKSIRVAAQLNHYGHECLPQFQTFDQFPAVADCMKRMKTTYTKLCETLAKKLPANFNLFMSGQSLTVLNTIKNSECEMARAIEQLQSIPEAVLRRTQAGGAIQVGIKTQPLNRPVSNYYENTQLEELEHYDYQDADPNVTYYVLDEESLLDLPGSSTVDYDIESNMTMIQHHSSSIKQCNSEVEPEDIMPIHLQDGRVKCPHCQLVLKNSASYKTHRINKHGVYVPRSKKKSNRSASGQLIEVDRNATCPVCKRNFTNDSMAEYCTFCEKTLHYECVHPHYENCVYIDYQ
uniref:C2H2-type domain-containing protein n=1 Tax=Acrobeloides nanus TaxID=290746 RepID=A0A914BZ77_9BILA